MSGSQPLSRRLRHIRQFGLTLEFSLFVTGCYSTCLRPASSCSITHMANGSIFSASPIYTGSKVYSSTGGSHKSQAQKTHNGPETLCSRASSKRLLFKF
ncbi:uncharacterized protein BDV17DRAFT_218885 [Aspergillus undulatus]|uniref:uncharacterized protein n=1 Tax=Aspergillus undulatus TaxID=1810928 RepID=UPI003CCE2E1C